MRVVKRVITIIACVASAVAVTLYFIGRKKKTEAIS